MWCSTQLTHRNELPAYGKLRLSSKSDLMYTFPPGPLIFAQVWHFWNVAKPTRLLEAGAGNVQKSAANYSVLSLLLRERYEYKVQLEGKARISGNPQRHPQITRTQPIFLRFLCCWLRVAAKFECTYAILTIIVRIFRLCEHTDFVNIQITCTFFSFSWST